MSTASLTRCTPNFATRRISLTESLREVSSGFVCPRSDPRPKHGLFLAFATRVREVSNFQILWVFRFVNFGNFESAPGAEFAIPNRHLFLNVNVPLLETHRFATTFVFKLNSTKWLSTKFITDRIFRAQNFPNSLLFTSLSLSLLLAACRASRGSLRLQAFPLIQSRVRRLALLSHSTLD